MVCNPGAGQCSLLSPQFLRSHGGLSKCQTELGQATAALGVTPTSVVNQNVQYLSETQGTDTVTSHDRSTQQLHVSKQPNGQWLLDTLP